MIISASRRTDIPAFFSDWFIKRVEEGYVIWANPFNARQLKKISLKPDDVDVIVFWTKNPGPLLKYLEQLDKSGFKYYFQFTLNDYPRVLEPNVPSLEQRIAVFQKLSNILGSERVIWRYDPIIISNITSVNYHIERFSHLASRLSGYTKRVVISFVDLYGKVSYKFKKLEKEHNVLVQDITLDRPRLEILCGELKSTVDKHNYEIFTCSEEIDLDHLGIKHGKCIDDSLIKKIFGLNLHVKKDKNQRGGCLCVESIDIGSYNTCRFCCSYCYATMSQKSVISNLKKHRTDSPLLIGDPDWSLVPDNTRKQLKLFEENDNKA